MIGFKCRDDLITCNYQKNSSKERFVQKQIQSHGKELNSKSVYFRKNRTFNKYMK